MPTYQYLCTECGGQLEVVQKFTDDALTVHDACGGRLRKVFSPVGIVFKGSGFYRTDSRNGSNGDGPGKKDKEPSGAKPDSKSGSSADSGSSGSSGSGSSDSSSSKSSSSSDSGSGSSGSGSSGSSSSGSSSGSGDNKGTKTSASAASS